jgi:hypothetical protein
MISTTAIKIKSCLFLLVIITALLNCSCNRRGVHKAVVAPPLSFKSIKGIAYTEVHRALRNGLSFDDDGFQTELPDHFC